ncbi:hypothetical protein M8C21_000945 [Ambrosia artemisiifolia]|uniref:Uncharacterized protein n=1 Tax=Ambrosia artemisiifolia TaxID=4212 RepID=A0AAD5C2C5_AMBAR|nr:hypothetical protein M8C21_000945 [Ambrosia artemisiifolia]
MYCLYSQVPSHSPLFFFPHVSFPALSRSTTCLSTHTLSPPPPPPPSPLFRLQSLRFRKQYLWLRSELKDS